MEKFEKERPVFLVRSIFHNRPSTLVFDYLPQCKKESRINRRCVQSSIPGLKYRICTKSNKYNSVLNTLKSQGFTRTNSNKFNIYYGGLPKASRISKLVPSQKYNHFAGSWQLGRKDYLYRNIAKMKSSFRTAYDFCPVTYILPEDSSRFLTEQHKNTWIYKPSASSCGKGIKLINQSDKPPSSPGIISKYISNPHTLQGKKYDLRLYVCVTSFDPLKIYLYKEGLVRLATERYTTKNLKNQYIHLTNYSVNKRSPNYIQNHSNDESACKWSLTMLRNTFAEMGIDYEKVFARVKDVIIKTLIAVEANIISNTYRLCHDKSACFELYGFDIMLDERLKPWLLEVNVSPSLSSSSPFDRMIKTRLMCDVFTLVGIDPYKTNVLDEELNMIFAAYEESARSGDFERIFPLKNNISEYRMYFSQERYNNTLLWRTLMEPGFLHMFYNYDLCNMKI